MNILSCYYLIQLDFYWVVFCFYFFKNSLKCPKNRGLYQYYVNKIILFHNTLMRPKKEILFLI
jgi:hypothetical protein